MRHSSRVLDSVLSSVTDTYLQKHGMWIGYAKLLFPVHTGFRGGFLLLLLLLHV